MKKLTAFWLFCLFIIFTQPAFAKLTPALWQVEKQGKTSYLFGTVHVGDSSMNGLPKKIEKAIGNSEAVVVEVDLSALTAVQIQQRSMPFLMLQNGRTLDSELSPKSYQQLDQYFGEKSINIKMFSELKPWAVLLTVMQIELQNAGYSDQFGIDKQVMASAAQHNKPIIELESLEQQLEMFTVMEEHADHMVADTFRQISQFDDNFQRLIDGWKKGETAMLAEAYEQAFDDSEFGQLNEHVLLVERNHKWIKQLEKPLSEQSLFIAVGALHLGEENGLIKLLQGQGFKVTRI
ncbi:TraB/GumN family protein [Pseudoalteromonas sp. T1lg75]|uniref:TraB/GumN family protein n=1 Tax=Pseudoalteromonas sp. T1lg75 TaxID=2077102 RepID=UPI000CF66486|nr:TraB/GumN family protein [Pseudoalteromonas sp. T1lg75]